MNGLNEQIDLILEHSLLEEQIGLILEHSLEEEVSLDERRGKRKKSRNKGKIENWPRFSSFWRQLTDIIQDYTTEDEMRDFASSMQKGEMPIATGFKTISGNAKRAGQSFIDTKSSPFHVRLKKIQSGEISPEEEEEETTTTPPVSPPTPPATPPATEPDEDAPLTASERAAVERDRDIAIDLLTKRAILMGPSTYDNMRALEGLGRIVRKYFISKTTLREAPGEPPSRPSPRTPSADTTADMLRQMSIDKPIRPEEAAENLQALRKKIKANIVNDKWNSLRLDKKDEIFNITKRMIIRGATGALREDAVLKEDKLVEIVVDFNELRKNRLDESWLAMFGGWIEHLLKAMFGGWTPPVSVRGSQRDINAFAKAIGGEKRYIETARQYGLDHPTTYKSKSKLDVAVKGFEKDTGLTWPFK